MPDTPAAASPPHSDVIVYTSPSCSQCNVTKVWLRAKDIPYTEIDTDLETAAWLGETTGFVRLPIVMVGNRSWSGFRIDKLKTLLR